LWDFSDVLLATTLIFVAQNLRLPGRRCQLQ
jgi:hypothetical protein